MHLLPSTRRHATPLLAVLALFLLTAAPGSAQQEAGVDKGEEPIPRVLMVGDSWADLMWAARTMRDVFADNGRPDIEEDGSSTTLSGSTAEQWAGPSMLQSISDALDATQSLDVVQLTIGGNDFLDGQSGGGWHTGISPQELTTLHQKISGDIATVVDHILAYDPLMQVVISLYDYVNFPDASSLLGCDDRWNDLGQPTPRQINDASVALQQIIRQIADSRQRVVLIDHAGSMQELYGFPNDGIQPGDLERPGDLDRPSPIEAMLFGLDCIHLSSEGYATIGQNLWDGFYADYFAGGLLFADNFETGDTTAWDELP